MTASSSTDLDVCGAADDHLPRCLDRYEATVADDVAVISPEALTPPLAKVTPSMFWELGNLEVAGDIQVLADAGTEMLLSPWPVMVPLLRTEPAETGAWRWADTWQRRRRVGTRPNPSRCDRARQAVPQVWPRVLQARVSSYQGKGFYSGRFQ